MCFYLPWIIALVLWIFLLRSLKNHDKNLHYSFGNLTKRHQSIESRISQPNTQSFIERDQRNLSECLKMRQKSSRAPLETFTNSNSNGNRKVVTVSKLRSQNVNKLTLTVVVLCFTNLICR